MNTSRPSAIAGLAKPSPRSSSHTSAGAVEPKSERSGVSRQIPSLRGPRNDDQSSVTAPSARGRGAAWDVSPGVGERSAAGAASS